MVALLWAGVPAGTAAQALPTGYPLIEQVTTDDFYGSGQTWAIGSDSRGLIYFGNSNYGIQFYNGQGWQQVPTPDNTPAYALARHPQTDRLYVSTRYHFGYISEDSLRRPIFVSLADTGITRLGQPSNDTQHILFWNDQVIVNRENIVASVDPPAFTDTDAQPQPRLLYRSPTLVEDIAVARDTLWLFDAAGEGNLLYSTGDGFNRETTPFYAQVLFARNGRLHAVTPQGHWYVRKNGQWQIQSEVLSTGIYEAIPLHDGSVAVTTLSEGLYILNRDGSLKYHITSRHGLTSNQTKNLFQDQRGNVWVSGDTGINKIEYASPVRTLQPDQQVDDNIVKGRAGNQELLLGGRDLWKWDRAGQQFNQVSSSIELIYNIRYSESAGFLIASRSGLYQYWDGALRRLLPQKTYDVHVSRRYPQVAYALIDNSLQTIKFTPGGTFQSVSHHFSYDPIAYTITEDSLGHVWIGTGSKGNLPAPGAHHR